MGEGGGSNKSERTLIRLISPLLLKRRLFSLNKKRKKFGPRALLWPPVFLWGRRIYDYTFFQSMNVLRFYGFFHFILLSIYNMLKVNSSLKAPSTLKIYECSKVVICYYIQLEYVTFWAWFKVGLKRKNSQIRNILTLIAFLGEKIELKMAWHFVDSKVCAPPKGRPVL